MSAKIHHFRIGLFVLAGAALLIAALFAVGLKAYFGKRDIFETIVTGKVETLSVGALVKLRGVSIGKVISIEFVGSEYPEYKEQYVLIKFEVPHGKVWSAQPEPIQQSLDKEVAQGLRARVQTQGLVGESILALEYVDPKAYPVEPIPWVPKNYYIPSAPSQFNRLITSLEKSLSHVEELDLAGLQNRANKLLDAANHLAGSVDQIDFRQLGTNVDSLIARLREVTSGIQETLSDVQKAINGADLPAVSRDASALLAKISSAAVELRHTLASVDIGELNASLANIRVATDDLIVLIHNLEQRPSSVLFSKSPNPITELEKPPKK